MSDLRDELAEALIGWPVGECERYHETSSVDVREMVDAILPIVERETDAAHQRGLLDGVMIERRAVTDDLRERMEKARKGLGEIIEDRRHLPVRVDRMDIARLAGKASGVSLCLDYLRAYYGGES